MRPSPASVVAAVLLAAALGAKARADAPPGGERDAPPPATATATPGSLLEAVRAAVDPAGAVGARAARLRALGPGALALLLAEPGLARAADDLFLPAIEGLDDAALGAAALGWLARGPEVFARAVERLPAAPRAALLESLIRFVALEPPDDEAAERAESQADAIIERAGLGPLAPLARSPEAADRALRAAVAAALGRSAIPEAVPLLLDLAVDEDPRVALAAVRALGITTDGSDLPAALLETYLGKDALPSLRRAAVIALGRLRASEAVEELLPLLEAGDEGLRRDAHWALCEIAGRTLPLDAGAWRALWAEERARAEREVPLLLAELDSGEPLVVARALRTLPSFRAERTRIRSAMVPLLGLPNPGLRAAACAALSQLRDPCAVPALVRALDDPDPGVWDAAWKALRQITGRDLPARSADWRRRNR